MKIIWVVVIGVAAYALGCVTGCIATRDGEANFQASMDKLTKEMHVMNELEKKSE